MKKTKRLSLNLETGIIICDAEIKGPKGIHDLRLALDTGASVTIIAPEAAFRIGVNPAQAKETREILTGSSKVLCSVVTIPKFISLGHAIRNLEVLCHTLPDGSPVDGLLGLNFLSHFDLRLNFRKAFLEIQ
ncbi:MAG: hypothetical protein A3G87_04945 [Omnitrophica bacterium RIFCSPLOWO2_12_FULL_50_11]|nr:MAG: hypothetical protein A3G87_04945 [Omnitrophica bacterium RIFCSPLOWO2_12_FULL_50_11]